MMSNAILVGVIGIIVLFGLMFLRVPVSYAMIFVGLVGIAVLRGWQPGVQTVVSMLYSKFTSYSYSAVPMFIFMGYLAYYANMMEALFDVVKKWIGHIHGGLVISGIIGGAGFGAVCGAASASSATLSRVVVPELLNAKTDRSLAFGSVVSSALLAPLIPPSVLAMLIAVVLEVSIGQVLMGGMGPGIILAVLFSIVTYITVRKNPERAPLFPKSDWGSRWRALPKIWDFALVVFLIVGSIYFGWCSPTEAGAISCAAIIAILAIKRKLTIRILIDSLKDTLKTTTVAFFVVGTAFAFSSFLTLTKIPNVFSQWIVNLNIPDIAVISLILLFFIILGMFMDIMSVVYVTVPILAPVVSGMGYSLVWFGVMLLVVAVLGGITPPFGGNLFILKACIKDSTLSEIYKGAMPFVWITLAAIVAFTLFPQIILFLPNLTL